MTFAPRSAPRSLTRDEIRLGELLAEGGEGRVFELPLQPDMVFKEYRRAVDRRHLEDLVAWPESGDPELMKRIGAAASWPEALVERGRSAGRGARDAVGVLVARAPRRFSLRHRDGTTRLATLSYLTADPAYREVAYGLSFPAPFSAERLGIAYALARVLEAFDRLEPRVGHGDLSAKNVLWSLQRGPEVFVIDCDNCERYGTDGRPLSMESRRRAMTPNWDDPAVPHGANPELTSDRYSLAVIFLRVVGAANFPVQARQRQGGAISIDFPIPPGYAREVLLGPGSPLWSLCARGLSAEHADLRPEPSEWVAALEAVLDGLGAAHIMHSVWSVQGGGSAMSPVLSFPGSERSAPRGSAARDGPTDVTVRPVVASGRIPPPKRVVVSSVSGPAPEAWHAGSVFVTASGGSQVSAVASANTVPTDPILRQLAAIARIALRWWLEAHRSMVRGLARRDRAGAVSSVQRLVVCAAVDLGVAVLSLFLVAMAVAPFLGI
ncbi:MAG TPA: hypothetical protein VMO88_11640 [Acidimicrobiales bacterium]|nr:hypothetical protein [Acidimicrobiales bacterium]